MFINTNTITKSKRLLSNGIFKNIGWLFIDKLIRLGIGLILGIWIARYLGPNQFGKWNYVIALTSLLSVFATLGLDSIVIRDVINESGNLNQIIGTAFVMRVVGSFLITIVSCIIVYFTEGNNTQLLIIVFLTSISYIFLSFDVIDLYFQSKLKSKYPVIAKFTAFILCSSLRILAILLHFQLLYFVFLAFLEVVIGAVFLIVAYKVKAKFTIMKWEFGLLLCKQKIKEVWPLILSGMVVMIYMRIDQVMLQYMKGETALGIYSAAVRVSEVWYLIPTILATSFYPNLLTLKNTNNSKYRQRFELLYSISFIIPFFISIFVTFFSKNIIGLMYGQAYIESAYILKVNIWAGIFVFLGVASSNYMIIEDLNKLSFYKTLIGAICNVILNFILIPTLGGIGAAVSTLIAYAIAAYFSNLFFPVTYPLFLSMSRAIKNSFKISYYKQ